MFRVAHVFKMTYLFLALPTSADIYVSGKAEHTLHHGYASLLGQRIDAAAGCVEFRKNNKSFLYQNDCEQSLLRVT